METNKKGVVVSILAFSETRDYGKTKMLDTTEATKDLIFYSNFESWNTQTNMLSDNNLDNDYFEAIVAMGVDAVPFIKEELKKGPTMLVYALDRIIPNTIVPQGYIPLPILCNTWMEYLNREF